MIKGAEELRGNIFEGKKQNHGDRNSTEGLKIINLLLFLLMFLLLFASFSSVCPKPKRSHTNEV